MTDPYAARSKRTGISISNVIGFMCGENFPDMCGSCGKGYDQLSQFNSSRRTSPEALREMVEGWPRNARFTGVKSERADGMMVATCRIFPTTDWNFGTGARVFFNN